MTVAAPHTRAHWRAKAPIGPAPCTTTVSPRRIPAWRTPWKATVAGSTIAAVASSSVSGTTTMRSAEAAMRGANAPCGEPAASRTSDIVDVLHQSVSPARHSVQAPHAGRMATDTRSPSATDRTSAATADTVPDHSWPQSVAGYGPPWA